MPLGVARARHVEAAERGSGGNKVARIGKIGTARQLRVYIATQRKHIFHVCGAQCRKRFTHLPARGMHTSKVRKGLDAQVVFDVRGDLRGGLPGHSAARAVGDADEIRLESAHGL